MTIDRSVRLRSGAIALRRNGAGWEITPARPDGYDRPWARTRAAGTARSSTTEPSATPPQPWARDATPKPADLEADD
jgi:competence protein ComEC